MSAHELIHADARSAGLVLHTATRTLTPWADTMYINHAARRARGERRQHFSFCLGRLPCHIGSENEVLDVSWVGFVRYTVRLEVTHQDRSGEYSQQVSKTMGLPVTLGKLEMDRKRRP